MLSRSIGYQPIYGIYLLFPSSPPPQRKYFISKSLSPFIHRPDIFLLRIFSFSAIIQNSGVQGPLIGSYLRNALGVVLVVDDLDGYLMPLLNRGCSGTRLPENPTRKSEIFNYPKVPEPDFFEIHTTRNNPNPSFLLRVPAGTRKMTFMNFSNNKN